MQIWTGEHSAAMWLEQSKTIFRLTHVEWKQGPQGTSDFLAFYEIFVKRAPLSVMLPRQFDYIIQPPCRLAAYARHLASWLSYSPLYTKWYYFVQNVVKAFNAFVTSYSYIYIHIYLYINVCILYLSWWPGMLQKELQQALLLPNGLQGQFFVHEFCVYSMCILF